jgi:rare lipoprotein A
VRVIGYWIRSGAWSRATSRLRSFTTCAAVAIGLTACAQLQPVSSPQPESPVTPQERAPAVPAAPVPGTTTPQPEPSTAWRERGKVSHYGKDFEGKPTASGDPFDPKRLTMAHRTLPFGTLVRVTNLENQRSVDVVVTDRGPFVQGRIADLSTSAAQRIGMVADGVVDAMLEVLRPSKPR